MNRIFSLTFILALAPFLGNCAKIGGTRNELKDALPHSPGEIEAKLGEGYDSLNQEIRNTPSCVTGLTSKLESTGIKLTLDQNIDINKLQKEFTGEVRGTPRIIFQEAGAALGYYNSINRNQAAINIAYAVKVDLGGERLSSVTLSESSKSLSPLSLYQLCGDHYIAQVNRGGLLTITLTLDFLNEENRNKWQSKLKLTGSWAEISKDLSNKVEKSGIDGVLTIKVNQIGGIPSQAITASKSCPLVTIENFQTCKENIDSLLTYASDSFPKQIETNPAITGYITAPLQGLGISGLPVLSDEILQIRSKLEELNNQATYSLDMLNKGTEAALEFENDFQAAIRSNYNLIKLAGKTCFTNKISADAVDWNDCIKMYSQLNSKLAKIDQSRVTVSDLTVPADSEIGNSIINPYTSKMVIAYRVSGKKNWFIDSKNQVDIAGISSDGKSSLSNQALRPNEKLGTLLLRQGQSYLKPDMTGRVEINPGEAIAFVLNDDLSQYADNRGSQVITWRCMNCNEKFTRLPTYRLIVRADSEVGVVFRSSESQTGTFRAMAYGLWKSASSWPSSDPRGITRVCGQSCPAPEAGFQTLVMSTSDGRPGVAIGLDRTVGIAPKAPYSFLMNDQPGGYKDNVGTVELILQCQKCDLKAHPIILDGTDI